MTHPSVHARTQPDKIAYQMAGSGKAITYRELDELSNQGAHLFRSLGLKAGDHIALLIENRLAFMEICWAAQRSGLYYTAISRYLTQEEIAYIVRDCGARLVITSPKCAEQIQGLVTGAPGEPLFYMIDEPLPGFRSWDKEAVAQPTTPITDEVAGYDMLYSSGTTGRPKGIKRQSEHNPIDQPNPFLKILCADMCGMNSDSIYLSPAPLYHAAPLRFNMMAITLGGTSVIMESFDAEEFLRLVEKHKITQSQLVPTMFVRMLKLPEGRDPCRRALSGRRQGKDDRMVGADPDRILRRLRRQRRHRVHLAAVADPSRDRRPGCGRQDKNSRRER
jgi:fatty-acyl-CoA synthase/long-chain acyl-CoA synthetase